ncbi:hypothetical protein M514_13670 [Trichuris suis]|uniref:Peptidase S1 domain-containing protein n=1 Tax=Trichuris suis TaxID=68888 RepID=A0A085NDG4_9BILA|nr:hypothetical protein M514_13670 [Trichuris suis]
MILNWTILSFLLLITVQELEATKGCGLPKEYGGADIRAYVEKKSKKISFPWTVALKHKLGKFKCLGSIIPEYDQRGFQRNSSALILTAGSCFRHSLTKRWGTPRRYKVYAGIDRVRPFLNSGSKSRIMTVKIVPLAAVNDKTWNGVALATLEKPLVFNKVISPICLPSQYDIPPNTATCFASSYNKRRIEEESVTLVPGSICDFGQLAELNGTHGLCTHQKKDSSEKSTGAALFCIMNGRAYQYGIYLSQLMTGKVLSNHKKSLHFYGHVTSAFAMEKEADIKIVQLGSSSTASALSDESSKGWSVSKGSSESEASTISTACSRPSADKRAPGPIQPSSPPCIQKPKKTTDKKTKLGKPGTPERLKVDQVFCGDTSTFGRNLESYVEGNNAHEMLPWNVIIATRIRGSVKCMGSLIHNGDPNQSVNSSNLVLTAEDCITQSKKVWSASPSLRVYAGSSLYSRIKRRGKKVKVSSFNVYSLPWGNEKVRKGIALIKLEHPLVRKDGVVPICLAPRDELPPLHASCYVSHYDSGKHLVEEELVMLTRKPRCLDDDHRRVPTFRGICTMEEKRANHLQLGAPMTCIIGGRAFQYGVYLNHVSLEINTRAKQMLGYYSELNIIHDVLFGKKVSTEPGKAEHRHPATVPTMPVQKPTKVSIDPAAVPVTIFSSQELVSLSLSSSIELQKTQTPSSTYDSAGPIKPSSHVEPIPQHLIIPAPVHTSSKSRSSSQASSEPAAGSLSTSSSFSAESNMKSAEIEARSASAEESFQSSEAAKILRVKVQSVRSPILWGMEQPLEEPVILPAVSSEETKEHRPHVVEHSSAPVSPLPVIENPYAEISGKPNDINMVPITVAPVTLKTESKSSSSSSSASSGSKSKSVEYIEFPATDEEPTPLTPPSSPEQIKPCPLPQLGSSPNTPSAPVICPSMNNGKEQFDHTVSSPFPIPEYPSVSVESNHQPLKVPPLMRYDLSSKNVTDHEHIMVHMFTGTPSGPCSVSGSEESGFNRFPHASGGSVSGSSSLSHIRGSHETQISGSASSLSHVSGGVHSGVQVSGNFYGASGALNSGITSSGHLHESSIARSGGSSYSRHTEGTIGMLNTGSASTSHLHGNHYSGITSSSSVRGSTRIHSSEIGFSSNNNVRASNERHHGTFGMQSREVVSSKHSHGTSGTQIISSTSSENLQRSSRISSGNFSSQSGGFHGSFGVQSGGIAASNCKLESVGNGLPISSGSLPGASGVHIFDVSGTSAEEACTGTLYVEPGKTYSDQVITAARCVWSRASGKYVVYVGSLLPRHMTTEHISKTLVQVERIHTIPFYAEHADLKAMGMAILKLKHKVKAIQGVQSFSLPHVSTGAYPSMQCFVSGVCDHGMPVRVRYQLLSPKECRSRLGQKFFPSLMYCGIGRKDILQFPVGAPLVCDFYGKWTQFGIYDHAPRFAKVDRFGGQEAEDFNEVALFMKLDGDEQRENRTISV